MKTNRRNFIKQTASLSAAGVAPWLLNLSAIAEASAQNQPPDYKALVCIFLNGGNDPYNTVIPLGTTEHGVYLNSRPLFAVMRSTVSYPSGQGDIVKVPIPKKANYSGMTYDFPDLTAADQLPLNALRSGVTTPTVSSGRYGLAPSLTALHQLYTEQVLAPVLNVGPLIEPTIGVKVGTTSPSVNLRKHKTPSTAADVPPKLESHNDQMLYWQAMGSEGVQQGWGGRLLDYAGSSNVTHSLESFYTSGNPVWNQGASASSKPYQISQGSTLTSPFKTYDSGIVGVNLQSAIESIMTGNNGALQSQTTQKLQWDVMDLANESFALRGVLSSYARSPTDGRYAALRALAKPTNAVLPSDNNTLASQLMAVAHAIDFSRNSRQGDPRRQVFFVQLGGFDTHSSTKGAHDILLQHVGQAMLAFYRTLQALNVADQVTTFTASDFGRTLSGNGDGSDHGWGGHHFVMGGAVKGGVIHGFAPELGDMATSATHTAAGEVVTSDRGRGRLIPTTSVEQYGATLARWMGVTDAQMPSIFKNIDNFPPSSPATATVQAQWPRYLGFLPSV